MWDFRGRHRHARLDVYQQRPVDLGEPHGRCVCQRELQLRCERQPDRLGLYDEHRQRANPLAWLHVHLDADGDMITETNTSTGDAWTYTYNFRNLMTGAVEKTSDDTVMAQVTYTYDALGNRIGMDENSTQTWTLYDGSMPIMDFNSSGSLEMRYLNGPARATWSTRCWPARAPAARSPGTCPTGWGRSAT